MVYEAQSAALVAEFDVEVEPVSQAPAITPFPANDVADPEAGWATRNPNRAMLFLFVTPRDCAAVDELMAL